MSLLLWNYYGLGTLCTRKELGVLVRAKDSLVVFLAETWVYEDRLKEIKGEILFDGMFFVPRVNRGGGLVMYWRNSINLSIEFFFSKNHIDSIINKGT